MSLPGDQPPLPGSLPATSSGAHAAAASVKLTASHLVRTRRQRRNRWLLRGAAPLALVALLVIALRPHDPHAEQWDEARVTRSDAVAWLRETGTLAPRDPVVIAAPFDGKLQWVVEDSTWVQQGDPLFIISDDDELKKVAEERQQLEEAKQDRILAQLKLEQAGETEARKVRKAHDDLVLEQSRHRIMTTSAVGGLELVQLDGQLRPLAERTTTVRTAFELQRDAWQKCQDAYLDRLDGWEQHQDALLALENRLDELDAREREARNRPLEAIKRKRREPGGAGKAAAKVDSKSDANSDVKAESKADDTKPDEDPAVARAAALQERQRLAALTAGLQDGLQQARAARDAAAVPRDAAAALLTQAEDAERELRIRIEIEKRALPATQLALDLKLAEIAASEAARKLKDGAAALAAQVLSRAAYDDLVAANDQARTQLATTRERLALAARPPGPEVLAEAEARLAKAQQAAEQAEAVRTRNLDIQRQEGAVYEARIARLEASLALRARRFPSTIEQEIAARERERTLHPEDETRLAGEIAGLQQDLAKAKAAPPSVLIAPVSGLARVRREGDRQKLAGDQAWQADPMCEVYPPDHMEVVVRLNEVNVPKVRQGMRVNAEIPALGRLPRSGVITQVAGVGRDKNELLGRKGSSGVTQYEARIELDPGTDHRDGDFRQGMTALVAIELERVPNALVLPRAAVESAGGAWVVHRAAAATPLVAVPGRPLGDQLFLLSGALQEGDAVYVRRIPNR